MVRLITTHACEAGNHAMCNGGDKVPPGTFGGTLCTCSCHRDVPVCELPDTREPFTSWPRGSFPAKLRVLINSHSIEGGSNTPDFTLAEYLKRCLETFDMCVRRREEWYKE